eukprot:gene831-33562_t
MSAHYANNSICRGGNNAILCNSMPSSSDNSNGMGPTNVTAATSGHHSGHQATPTANQRPTNTDGQPTPTPTANQNQQPTPTANKWPTSNQPAVNSGPQQPSHPRAYTIWKFEGGNTLQYYLKRRDTLKAIAEDLQVPDSSAVATVMKQIFESLVAFHNGGLVHRDVKPQNMIFAEDDQRFKLIDLVAEDDQRFKLIDLCCESTDRCCESTVQVAEDGQRFKLIDLGVV